MVYLSKPQYRSLWHPKHIDRVVAKKEPGFSFRLAIGCVRAIAQTVVTTLQLLLDSKEHITDKKQAQKQIRRIIEKAISLPICSIEQNESDQIAKTQTAQKLKQSDRIPLPAFHK